MNIVTVIGAGTMGAAIASRFLGGGIPVQVLSRDKDAASVAIPLAKHGIVGEPILGKIIVLAVPYSALTEVLETYDGQLESKVLVDVSNPVDLTTFDSLMVLAGSSATEEISWMVPGAAVLKAFNTNFAATLTSGVVHSQGTKVLIAGDDSEAKAALSAVVEASGLTPVDVGSRKRAHELESLGFLQLTLAMGGQTSWNSGFTLAR